MVMVAETTFACRRRCRRTADILSAQTPGGSASIRDLGTPCAGNVNLYGYVDNQPTYSADPTGLYEGGSGTDPGNSAILTAVNNQRQYAWYQSIGNWFTGTARTVVSDVEGGVGYLGTGLKGLAEYPQALLDWHVYAQGGANIGNGIQDAAMGLANAGIQATPAAMMLGGLGDPVPVIASPDWSNNLFVANDPADGVGKFLGGNAAVTLLTAGAGALFADAGEAPVPVVQVVDAGTGTAPEVVKNVVPVVDAAEGTANTVGALEDWPNVDFEARLAARGNAWETDNAINIHGNSINSPRTAYLYGLYDKETNQLLKWGIT